MLKLPKYRQGPKCHLYAEGRGRQDGALGYTSVHLPQIRALNVAKDLKAALVQEGGDPGAEFGGQAECGKFGEKSTMPNTIESFGHVKADSKGFPMPVNSLAPKVSDIR